jgi:hypothetical protein
MMTLCVSKLVAYACAVAGVEAVLDAAFVGAASMFVVDVFYDVHCRWWWQC